MASIIIDVLGLNQIFRDVATFIANIALQIQEYVGSIVNNLHALISNMVSSLINTIQPVINNVFATVGNLVSQIQSSIGNILQQIGNAMFTLIYNVENAITTTVSQIGNQISGIVAAITTELKRLFVPVADAIKTIVDEIKGIGAAIFDAVADVLVGLWNDLTQAFQGTIDSIRSFISDALANISAFVGQLVTAVRGFISDSINYIKGIAEGVIQFVGEAITELTGFVRGVVESFASAVSTTVGEIKQVSVGALNTILGASDSLISEVNSRLTDIKAEFTEAADSVVEGLKESVGAELKEAVHILDFVAKTLKDAFSPEELGKLTGLSDTLISPDGNVLTSRQDAIVFFREFLPKEPLPRMIFALTVGAGMILRSFWGIADAQAQVMQQEFAKTYHFQLLSPADATAAYRRQAKPVTQLIDAIVKQGYTPEDAGIILDNSEGVPAIGDLLALWLRGLIGDQQLEAALFQHGFDKDWAGKLSQLAEVIPPVGDLVTMAVREVFDKPKADALGLFEEFPEDFGKWAKKQGLSRDWAERYWAAHWTLPSATQGAEMLQRGEITPDEYDDLLKALDYSPTWRNKLKNIAFNPLTRVDIRRMHKIGVITDEELVDAYARIGYDPVDATRLAHFTIQLTAGVSPEDDEELGKLTRASILGFFDDGLIGEERAKELLISIGQTPEAARLYLETVKFDNQRAERKAEIDLILELAAAGVATFDEAHDRLAALGLETVEVQNALAKLLRADQKRSKLPTREEALTLYIAGFIRRLDYEDLLKRLGYSAKWITAFLLQAEELKNAD